jgi:hypothetical protein
MLQVSGMFMVSEMAAAAIRRAFEEGGDCSAVVELRRHFPLTVDDAQARLLVRTIAGWQKLPPRQAKKPAVRRPRSTRS